MSWRKIDLAEGCRYRISRSVSTPMDQFEKGEILLFVASPYSRYDSATILQFADQNGATKQFFLHDDEELAPDLFEIAS